MNARFFCILAAAVPALVMNPAPVRADDGWTEDFPGAKAAAAKENRDLFIEFTGSDWCPPCMQLHENILSKDAFKVAAQKNFVLVKIDFPQEIEQPAAVKAQNEKLQKEYNIEGFPTVVLADAAGRPYAVSGYEEVSPSAYLAKLEKLRKLRVSRDAGLKKAAAAEGSEKAKLIMSALKEIDGGFVHTFYSKEIDEAIAADKDDTSGAKKARAAFEKEQAFKVKVAALEEELAKLHEDEKLAEFIARIDKFIADEKPEGAKKQELLIAKMAGLDESNPDAMLKLLDEVIAVDPKSDLAEQAKMMKEQMQEPEEKEKKEKSGEDEK